MPIDYTNSRPSSVATTALMRRINALEEPVRIDRWDSDGETTFGVMNGIHLSIDKAGYIYSHNSNGITTGVSSVVDKLEYGGGTDVLGLILYGTGTNLFPVLNGMACDGNNLWLAGGRTQPGTSNRDGYLKKFDLSGTEVVSISKTVGLKQSFHDVCIFSDGSIMAVWQDNTDYKLVAYNSDGSGEAVIVTIDSTSTTIGDPVQLDYIEIFSDDTFIVSVANYNAENEARRYQKNGTLLKTYDLPNSGGFMRGVVLSSDEMITGTITGNSLIVPPLNLGLYDIDGNFLSSTSFSRGLDDAVEDENGNLYWCPAASGLPSTTIIKSIVTDDPEPGYYTETEFFRYPDRGAVTNPESLGTPNAGVSVPVTGALLTLTNGDKHRPHAQTINDMRGAAATLAPYYINAVTGNAFVASGVSADNIFTVAIDAAQSSWTTAINSSTVTPTTGRMKSTDFSDIDLVLIKLEASALA